MTLAPPPRVGNQARYYGLWQVEGRSRTQFDDMVRLDLKYARGWSLWLDLEILAKTPGAVVSGSGAH